MPETSDPQHSSAETPEQRQQAMREVGPYITMGIQLAMFIGLGVLLGMYLDEEGSSFWTGILAGAGAVMGLIYFLVSVTRLEKQREKQRKKG
jgi:hypothetical protein